MRKESVLAVAVFLFSVVSSSVSAQTGRVFDSLTMQSEILEGERRYAVYLPPDYETSQRSYPVLYLLHGGGDDQSGWIQFGEVLHIADKAIQSGRATPMVIAMPDAHSGQRGYFNSPNGEWRYEDHFFEEFVPYIEKTYRIRSEKRYRAVAGLSMGGGGSFIYALHRPEMFSSACPLSASTGPLSIEDARERLTRRNQPFTEEQLEAYYQSHSVLELVNTLPVEQIKSVRWYIDCGDEDFLYEGNSLVHIALRKREIPHEFRIRDGGHTWTYWRTALPDVLEFISAAFHQH
ncbi:MAG: esterase family protein [Acidobacteriota bacterium]|nr:MAG: esterase family protein [Acidobacteriota bacterium]